MVRASPTMTWQSGSTRRSGTTTCRGEIDPAAASGRNGWYVMYGSGSRIVMMTPAADSSDEATGAPGVPSASGASGAAASTTPAACLRRCLSLRWRRRAVYMPT